MMSTDSTQAAPPSENKAAPNLSFQPNQAYLTAALRKAKNHKNDTIRMAQYRQVSILIYLYQYEKISMTALRAKWKYNKITSYRHTGALRKLGLIKWKGSHEKGAYYITDAGREFVEKNGK